MALHPCRECEKEVSSEASSCPHCGAPVAKPKRFAFWKVLAWGAGLFLGFLLIYGPYRGQKEQQLIRQALSVSAIGMTESRVEAIVANISRDTNLSLFEGRELLYWMICSGRFQADTIATHAGAASRWIALTGRSPKEGAEFILRNVMGERQGDLFLACADW